jgi:hypothetical protein
MDAKGEGGEIGKEQTDRVNISQNDRSTRRLQTTCRRRCSFPSDFIVFIRGEDCTPSVVMRTSTTPEKTVHDNTRLSS